MTAAVLTNLLAWSLQAACVVGAAALAARLLRVDAPAVRYAWWRATLVLCLLLPWLQGRRASEFTVDLVTTTATVAGTAAGIPAGGGPGPALPWPAIAATVLGAGMALRLAWIGVGLRRLRRLRCAGRSAPAGAHDDLQRALGTRAEIRYVPDLDHPVTFGLRRAVVLLPEALDAKPPAVRRAVTCHELLHVRRGDWAWLVAEEGLRAALWFHPAIWWLVSRVQLAREEVVDALAVRRLGARRPYVEALLAFATDMPPAPVAPFARRRHLFRRIQLVSKETAMSARQLVISSIAAAAIVGAGAWYAIGAFPLAQSFEPVATEPGALEVRAQPITPENPIPRRIHAVAPLYPQAAASSGLRGTVALRITLDRSGRVAEVRRSQLRLTNPANLDELQWSALVETFADAAAAAARQWIYEPPATPPIAFDVIFRFDPGAETEAAQAVPGSFDGFNRPRISGTPPSAPPPPAPAGALRVGDDLAPPNKTRDVPPVYPQEAQDARVGGVVVLEVLIDEAGRVARAEVTRSVPLLDQAALDAVRQWEYEPTLRNGVPVPVVMNVTVNFTLS